MCPLLSSQKQRLLQVARRSVTEAVQRRAAVDIFSLSEDGMVSSGAFVTLHRLGRLRGCIGQIGKPQPTVPLVAYCARAAALEDPRFRSVEAQELAEIEIELSILSALETISPERIEIGKHGLMVTSGALRGVLLPQVAREHGWSAARFLEETCVKAGLDRAAWRGGAARIEAFTAEIFSESQLSADSFPNQGLRREPGYSSST
jgi:uncharacterized protein